MIQEHRFSFFDEWRIYEESLKHYRDLRNTITSAERRGREEGRELGREEGREENKRDIALRMKADGLAIDMIAKYTGLTAEEIASL